MRCYERGAVLVTSLTLLFSLTFTSAWLVQSQLVQLKRHHQQRQALLTSEMDVANARDALVSHWQKTGVLLQTAMHNSQPSYVHRGTSIELLLTHADGRLEHQQLSEAPLFSALPQLPWISMSGDATNWQQVLNLTLPNALIKMSPHVYNDCTDTSAWQGIIIVKNDCHLSGATQIGSASAPVVLTLMGSNNTLTQPLHLYGVVIFATSSDHINVHSGVTITGAVLTLDSQFPFQHNIQFDMNVIKHIQTSPEYRIRKVVEGTWRDF